MMLLDTHVMVRYALDVGKLGPRAMSAIDRALARDELMISAISFWEMAMLVSKQRLAFDITVSAFREQTIRQGIREEVIDGEISIFAGELPETHGDPADRLLVATAMVRGLTLITADETLLGWRMRGFRTQDATA